MCCEASSVLDPQARELVSSSAPVCPNGRFPLGKARGLLDKIGVPDFSDGRHAGHMRLFVMDNRHRMATGVHGTPLYCQPRIGDDRERDVMVALEDVGIAPPPDGDPIDLESLLFGLFSRWGVLDKAGK